MNYSAVEYDIIEMSRDVSKMVSVTLEESDALYKYLLFYIPKQMVSKGKNLYVKVLPVKVTDEDEVDKDVDGRVMFKLGTGEYSFRDYQGNTLYALHHQLGSPVGLNCDVKVLKRLIIFSENSMEELRVFLNEAVERMETTASDKFICYTWRIRHCYWDEEVKVAKRPISSVVLPTELKNRVVNDMAKFLDAKTKNFYLRNGIPYRRSYLFYGTPGTGKTSLVQALAGHFGRNVCFLMPTHHEMTDDNLRSAVNSIPEDSIVVFEDIDALFDKERSNQVKSSSLTFSGLLNALDGIGGSNGQVFVLTTNLRENLDHALIRNGRVDLHFEFSYAIPEQMELMWCNFYPDAKDMASAFATAVSAVLEESNLQVTTATLQHFFVTQMDSTPSEALANVPIIVAEIRQNSSNSMLNEVSKKKDNKNRKEKKGKRRFEKEAESSENPAAMRTAASSDLAPSRSTVDVPKSTAVIPTAVLSETQQVSHGKKRRNRQKKRGQNLEGDAEIPAVVGANRASAVVSTEVEEEDEKKEKKKKNEEAVVVAKVADPQKIPTEPCALSGGEPCEEAKKEGTVEDVHPPLNKRKESHRQRIEKRRKMRADLTAAAADTSASVPV